MAIYQRCPKCLKDNTVSARVCKGCGSTLKNVTRYQVKVKDSASGKWRSKVVPNLKLAKEVEAKLKVLAVEQELFDKKQKDTVSFHSYLEHAKLHKKTWETDLLRWNKHVAGNDWMGQQGILQILRKQRDSGDAPATIHHSLKLIRRVFNWHIEQGLYHSENPCKHIKLTKYDNRVSNILNREQVNLLVEYCDNWKNRRAALVILFALFTGRRKGEILTLTWDDIDWEQQFITCRNTKNGSSISFPVNRKALDILHDPTEFVRVGRLLGLAERSLIG